MFHPMSLFVGLRYTRSRRRNHFISFISGFSSLGIALGVIALITVLRMAMFRRSMGVYVIGPWHWSKPNAIHGYLALRRTSKRKRC